MKTYEKTYEERITAAIKRLDSAQKKTSSPILGLVADALEFFAARAEGFVEADTAARAAKKDWELTFSGFGFFPDEDENRRLEASDIDRVIRSLDDGSGVSRDQIEEQLIKENIAFDRWELASELKDAVQGSRIDRLGKSQRYRIAS